MPSRRDLVTLALVAAGLSGSLPLRDLARAASDTPFNSLTSLAAALACSGRLGQACLRGLANTDISARNLAQLIIADLELPTNSSTPPQVKSAVQRRIRCDFEQRKTVDVDGWCLSLTETRLYAFALLQRQHGL